MFWLHCYWASACRRHLNVTRGIWKTIQPANSQSNKTCRLFLSFLSHHTNFLLKLLGDDNLVTGFTDCLLFSGKSLFNEMVRLYLPFGWFRVFSRMARASFPFIVYVHVGLCISACKCNYGSTHSWTHACNLHGHWEYINLFFFFCFCQRILGDFFFNFLTCIFGMAATEEWSSKPDEEDWTTWSFKKVQKPSLKLFVPELIFDELIVILELKIQTSFSRLNLNCLRRLLGEGLGSCTIDELQQIEQQLERSVSNIRARKVHHIQLALYVCLKHCATYNSDLLILCLCSESGFQRTDWSTET